MGGNLYRTKGCFEEELTKELGGRENGKLFKFFNRNAHKLLGFEAKAICHNASNDDVLFRIIKQGSDYAFAVVHLTWSGSKEVWKLSNMSVIRKFR